MQPWVLCGFLWDSRWGQSGFLVRLASAERDADACTNWPNCWDAQVLGVQHHLRPIHLQWAVEKELSASDQTTCDTNFQVNWIKALNWSVANCWANCSYLPWFVDSCCRSWLQDIMSFSEILGSHHKQTSRVHLITYVDRIWMHAIWFSYYLYALKRTYYFSQDFAQHMFDHVLACVGNTFGWLATYFLAASTLLLWQQWTDWKWTSSNQCCSCGCHVPFTLERSSCGSTWVSLSSQKAS